MASRFRTNQLVAGPGCAWYRVERIQPNGTYDLREVISPQLSGMGDHPKLRPGIEERYVRPIPCSLEPGQMNQAEEEMHAHLVGRREELLAGARLPAGQHHERVTVRTTVPAYGGPAEVAVQLQVGTGEVLRWQAL